MCSRGRCAARGSAAHHRTAHVHRRWQLLWSQRYDRQLDDVFAIQDENRPDHRDHVAQQQAVGARAASERHTKNVRAYSLYLKGRFEWNHRTDRGCRAPSGFSSKPSRKTLPMRWRTRCSPTHTPLQVDYRNMRVQQGFELAKEYARKAIELDDSLAEAHASLAWSLFIYDWDWRRADSEFRRAISCDPQYASAHQWYQFLLLSRGAVEQSLVEGLTGVEWIRDPSRAPIARLRVNLRPRYEQARFHLSGRSHEPNAEDRTGAGIALALDGNF